MKVSAKQLAKILDGEIIGNPKATVSDVSKIEEGKPGTISFLANPKYTKYIYSTKASIVLVNKDFEPENPITATLIKVKDSYDALASLLDYYQGSQKQRSGKEEPCFVHKKAKLGRKVYVGAFAYVGQGVTIGDNSQIFPNVYLGENVSVGKNVCIYAGVRIYPGCKIGDDCIIHAGSVIGSDGFGFVPKSHKDYRKIPQVGNVVLEDKVEIGANVCIDRATMGSTVIKQGVKLDNLIQIAHNVEIGENTVMAAQVGISGTTKIGAECMLAGQAGIIGHLNIGNKSLIGAQAGVSCDIEEGSRIAGSPAVDAMEFKRSVIMQKQLPQLRDKIKALEKEIEKLKKL